SMIGEKSKIAEVFQGKYIRKEGPRYIVDPRFPEVREHLIGILEKAAQKWGLDGFKLDFMSKMYPDPDTPNDLADGRDFASIDEATQQWIKDIYERLSVINPDLLIEFRQPHLNPATQQYGNMFRAIDNFNMEIANRIYIAKIKLAAPGLAVHSDMLKWHYDDPVDEAALQVLNGIFAVPQISVKLDSISKDHIAMVDFWMKYWTEHKDLMMKGHFQADDPGENYPAMHAFDDDRQISGLYATNLVKIKKSGIREIDIINATADETIYLDPGKEFGSKIQITTWNSQGQQVSKSHLKNRGDVIRIQAPKVGLVRIVGL
ncbi:MAG: hypothetical protein KI790_12420, partial [Cyclobacteriaceae bacterium]|nr:hypothetical protein [Cyclobacteriaceae bacterium HetDA_MAG_MS6]